MSAKVWKKLIFTAINCLDTPPSLSFSNQINAKTMDTRERKIGDHPWPATSTVLAGICEMQGCPNGSKIHLYNEKIFWFGISSSTSWSINKWLIGSRIFYFVEPVSIIYLFHHLHSNSQSNFSKNAA